MLPRVRSTVLACLVAVCSYAAAADTIERPGVCAGLKSAQQMPADALLAMDGQCALVARAQVSPRVLGFFATVPIVWDGPGDPALSRYDGATGVVHLRGLDDGNRPVLLHELMHAFHHRQLEGGWRNAEVAELLARARTERLFPAGSFVLSNEAEYFAIVATVFANGTAARVPRSRDELCQRQPATCEFLQRVLGSTQ